MATTTITIEVEAEAAKAFATASPEEQRKMQLLLSLRLQDLTTPQGKPLKAVMDEIGARAAARGLTPEILESLLRVEKLFFHGPSHLVLKISSLSQARLAR